MKAPLHGIRVLDLTRVLAGPWCTQLLGDLGADVVKVEMPGTGDDARQLGVSLEAAPGTPERPGRDSSFFLACNRNKRAMVADLAHPQGAALVRDLALQCDVLVENFKAGGLQKYGLDHATLRAANPRLIYCSITGFGQDGPYAPRPAYDFILQAMSGMMSTCGQPDGQPGAAPMRTAIPTTDLVVGYNAAVAILGAVIQRASSGQGQFIDAAMLDASVAFNVHLAQGYLMAKQVPQRQGNNNPIAAPSGVFQTADGWMVVAAGNDRQFLSMCRAIGNEHLALEPRFATNPQRVAKRAELTNALTPALLGQTTAHWLAVFEQHNVPCTAINTMDQVFEDPQVQHRQLTVDVAHGSGQPLRILRSTLNMSDHPPSYRAPPQWGQHTAEVLRDWLALTPSAIEQLSTDGAIAQR